MGLQLRYIDISKQLEKEYKIDVEVLDLRTINPLDEKTIIQSVKTKRLAIVEYGWPRCSISSEIISIVTKKINLKSKPLAFNWPNSHVPTPEKLEHQFYFRKKTALDKKLNYSNKKLIMKKYSLQEVQVMLDQN